MPQKSETDYDSDSDYIFISLQRAKEVQSILIIAAKHSPGALSKIPPKQLRDITQHFTHVVNIHKHLPNFQKIPVDKFFWNRIKGTI